MAKKFIFDKWFKAPFRVIRRPDRDYSVQGIHNIFYEVEINEHQLQESDNYLDELNLIFGGAIESVLAEHSKTGLPATRIRFVLTAPGLLVPINLPYITINDLTPYRIWEYIENFAQSNKDIILSEHLHFHFQFAP